MTPTSLQGASQLRSRGRKARIHLSPSGSMDATARRVAARFLSADSEGDLRKFRQLSGRAEKELTTLPRLFKTLDRQKHSYKGADPVKAKATQVKIMAKLKAIFTGYSSALHLVEAFESTYVPSNPFKTGSRNTMMP
jgi:hypothetical protein